MLNFHNEVISEGTGRLEFTTVVGIEGNNSDGAELQYGCKNVLREKPRLRRKTHALVKK